MLRIATALVFAALVSACGGSSYGGGYSPAAYSPPVSHNSDPSSPTIENDSYSPTIDIKTSAGQRGAAPNGTEIYGLYAKVDRATGRSTAYIQWSEVYTDREWRFFNRASNNKGQSYDFKQVARDVTRCSYGTCIYSETYNIYIPASDLRSPDGISFKIFGRNGDERVISVAPSLLNEFNAKVAEAAKLRK